MRILYATPGYKPAYRIGGPVVSVSATAERLVKRGHEVTVVTTNGNLDQDIDVPLGRPVDVDGVTVWYFRRTEPFRTWLPFIPYFSQSAGYLYAPEMRPVLERIMPAHDLVDTQLPFIYPSYIAARLALRYKKPLFYHQRGNYLDDHLSRRRIKKEIFMAVYEKPIMRLVDSLIALTTEEKEAFASVSPGTPCSVVPNGVDLPAVDMEAAARVQAQFGIPQDAIVILYLARLEPWKGAEELIEAFSEIQAKFPHAWLVMAGPDEHHTDERWRSRAESAGFGSRLLFPGVITGVVKSDFLQRADLFCLPSSGEALSMAILEALAHRTAALLSPGCRFAEAVDAGAATIAGKGARSIAAELCELLPDRHRLARMGRAGRALVEQKYSWDSVLDRLIAVYQRGAGYRQPDSDAECMRRSVPLRTNSVAAIPPAFAPEEG